MIRGLYTSSLGMTTQMKKMDVVSNNIANVSTTGYKKDLAVTRSFSEELMSRLNDDESIFSTPKVGKVTHGLFVDDIYTDFTQGSLENTGNTFDLSITGEGFFAVNVQGANGDTSEKYTRDGNFTLDSNGTLVTTDGSYVQGTKGNITIPNGTVTIDEQGNIYANSQFIDKLKIVDFEDKHSLRKYGDNFYDKTNESQEKTFEGGVVQGYLETSNVNSVKEMVEMITLSRVYEANQRFITTHDTILNRIANDIGRK